MRVHEDYCFCCDDGGELMECMQCPKVYHPACVGYSEVPAGYWACPWHSCVTCDRKGSSCGGVLFRCMSCPLSYCSECLPSTTTTTPGAGAAELKQLQPPDHFLDGFTRRGFPVPTGSAWVRCRHCSESMEAKQVERLRLQEELRLRSLREAEELRMRDEARMKLTEEYKRRKELKEQEMMLRLRTLKAMREQKEAELRQRRQLQEQMERCMLARRRENYENRLMEIEDKKMRMWLVQMRRARMEQMKMAKAAELRLESIERHIMLGEEKRSVAAMKYAFIAAAVVRIQRNLEDQRAKLSLPPCRTASPMMSNTMAR